MKRLLMISLLAGLAGCSSLQQLGAPVHSASQTSQPPAHAAGKVDLLLAEANRLADQVKSGALTRTAAADQLNAARLRIVGSNAVDNDNFAVYRQLTVERDAGRLDSDAFRSRLELHLREWMRRWPKYAPKPADPAFSNFLLKLYGLPPLGY
ncbi:hypothetical protein [Chromobacterium sphagni]|uniref:Prokaryotic membrane lipolipid attachment site family protein n=1 Tax=Chromobacterium sphagni TaxID=1903179 RepID=A0A1S1X631_9NEIS|nr:hypothetical protein [Chromobacterium sphagni]OHX14915.1 hypothetical protein BI347_05825 [Chromobacterium sphagni]OHX19403.1 hypothetical protein BI344_09565 [Chromobacterium sphagni]